MSPHPTELTRAAVKPLNRCGTKRCQNDLRLQFPGKPPSCSLRIFLHRAEYTVTTCPIFRGHFRVIDPNDRSGGDPHES